MCNNQILRGLIQLATELSLPAMPMRGKSHQLDHWICLSRSMIFHPSKLQHQQRFFQEYQFHLVLRQLHHRPSSPDMLVDNQTELLLYILRLNNLSAQNFSSEDWNKRRSKKKKRRVNVEFLCACIRVLLSLASLEFLAEKCKAIRLGCYSFDFCPWFTYSFVATLASFLQK